MDRFTISDILWSHDLLTETRLKPWWEKLIRYCIRGLYLVSFVMVYIVQTANSTSCTTREHYNNVSLSLSTTRFINNICYYEIPVTIRNSGLGAILTTTILYFIYNLWELFPVVMSGFRYTKKIDDKLQKKEMTEKEAIDLLEGRYKSNGCDFGLVSVYVLRNLLGMAGACLACFLIHPHSQLLVYDGSNTFTCNITVAKAPSSLPTNEFVCFNDFKQKLHPYAIIGIIFLALLIVFTLIGCIYSMYGCGCLGCDTHISKVAIINDCALIKLFSKSSHQLHKCTRDVFKAVRKNAEQKARASENPLPGATSEDCELQQLDDTGRNRNSPENDLFND